MNLTNRNGIWVLEYREKGKRVRISTGERDRARADDVARALLSGQHEKSRTWTLTEALNDCYDRIWSKQKSAEGARYLIDKLAAREGSVLVGQMSYAYLVELRKRMTAPEPEGWGVTESRANRYMSAISKALSEAVDLGKLEHRPKIPYGVEPKGKLRWLAADEESRLLTACGDIWPGPESQKMRSLLVFLLDTGARLSEALKAGADFAGKPGLSAIHQEQVAFVDTKNGSSRSVPLTQRARIALAYVPNWQAKFAVDRFTRLRNHCGLPDVSLHTMRHTCASRLVQGGMDLYRVMTWLGHSSINVTQRYAHLAPTSLDAGAAILSGHTAATPAVADTNRFASARSAPTVPMLKLVK